MKNSNIWSELLNLISELKCECRIKATFDDQPSGWDHRLIEPVPSSVELVRYGPVKKDDIKWLEINPVVETRVGKLVPNRVTDVREKVISVLERHEIAYEVRGNLIRVVL